MAEKEHEIWERKYIEGANASMEPDPFLLQAETEFIAPSFVSGNVLDIAGGPGRHARYFARKGWNVTLIDVAESATEMAKQWALQEKLSCTIVNADLDSAHFEAWQGRFDLVLVFFYLQRALFPALPRLLKSGGLLIYKTHVQSGTNSESAPKNPAHVLEPGELKTAFPELETLHYREHQTERSTAEYVGRKR